MSCACPVSKRRGIFFGLPPSSGKEALSRLPRRVSLRDDAKAGWGEIEKKRNI